LGLEGRLFRFGGGCRAFFDELVYMLAMQMAAPNSPQWFNTACTGLWHRRAEPGHFYVDFETGKLVRSKTAYEHPQPHACFIQSIKDDLVNEAGSWICGCGSAPVQIRLRHRHNFSSCAVMARSSRRRPLVRPHELPQDRRPRRRAIKSGGTTGAPPRW